MEGPRERIAEFGAEVLSDIELIAILLGTGHAGVDAVSLASGLLRQSGGVAVLSSLSAYELSAVRGIGLAKGARILAAFEIGARVATRAPKRPLPLSDSRSVFERYAKAWARSMVERFFVIAVDIKNRPIMTREIARGGRVQCQVDPSEVFRVLVRHGAYGAIFVHNHPSGDPEPSSDDCSLTQKLVAAGRLLQIRVLDHLVVGCQEYRSFADMGLLADNTSNVLPTR